jgi:hypothetical protein
MNIIKSKKIIQSNRRFFTYKTTSLTLLEIWSVTTCCCTFIGSCSGFYEGLLNINHHENTDIQMSILIKHTLTGSLRGLAYGVGAPITIPGYICIKLKSFSNNE